MQSKPERKYREGVEKRLKDRRTICTWTRHSPSNLDTFGVPGLFKKSSLNVMDSAPMR